MTSRLATRVLLWYARHVLYHRGKTRLSAFLRHVFAVELTGESVEQRDGLWWSFDRADYMSQDLYWSGANDRAELRSRGPRRDARSLRRDAPGPRKRRRRHDA